MNLFSKAALFLGVVTLIDLHTTHRHQALANAFDPPPGQGTPKGTAGGGSRPVRPGCLVSPETGDSPQLLAPKNYLGLTSQTRPTFWVYLPETQAKTIEFSLFDAQQKGIYQVQIPIVKSAGFTAISLPKTAPELSLDQPYHWTIALVCNPKRRTEDWVTGGWIARQQISSQLQQALKQTTQPIGRAKSYLNAHFWYDAITQLIEFQVFPSDSSDFKEVWSSAFESAGVSKIDLYKVDLYKFNLYKVDLQSSPRSTSR